MAKSHRNEGESGDVRAEGVEVEGVEDGPGKEEVDFLEFEVETEFVSQQKREEPSRPRVSRETSSYLHYWYILSLASSPGPQLQPPFTFT